MDRSVNRLRVRQFTTKDYDMLADWWEQQNQIPPPMYTYQEADSFILCIDGNPAMAVALTYTNNGTMCLADAFIGNPKFSGPLRKRGANVLQNAIERRAKEKGYTTLLALTKEEKVHKRHHELGYNTPPWNIYFSYKEIR